MIRGVQITARKCQSLKLETLLEVKTQLQKFVTVNDKPVVETDVIFQLDPKYRKIKSQQEVKVHMMWNAPITVT